MPFSIGNSNTKLGSLGTGLGEGLAALAHHKMQDIQRQKIADYFATQPGFTPESAQGFSQLPQYLQAPALKSRQPNVQQEEKQRAIANEYDILQEIIDTSDRIIKATENKDLSLGLPARGIAAIDPTLLNDVTATFNKDAAHLFNLKTEAAKGLLSKIRLTKLGEDKPGLNLSRNVNRKLAEQYRDAALKTQKNIEKTYPGFRSAKAAMGTDSGHSFEAGRVLEQLPNPKTYPRDKGLQLPDGRIMVSNGQEWIEFKG